MPEVKPTLEDLIGRNEAAKLRNMRAAVDQIFGAGGDDRAIERDRQAATGEQDEEPEGTGGGAAILPETGMCGPITRGNGR